VKALPKAVIVYNTTMHSSIGMSPSECLLTKVHDPQVPNAADDVKDTWEEGHPQYESFEVGQQVVKKVITRGRLVVDKLKPRYFGPFIVTRADNNGVTYEVEKIGEPNQGMHMSVHHRQIKKWVQPPDYLAQHPAHREMLSSRLPMKDDSNISDSCSRPARGDPLPDEDSESSEVMPLPEIPEHTEQRKVRPQQKVPTGHQMELRKRGNDDVVKQIK
jgi:hypothetical protein